RYQARYLVEQLGLRGDEDPAQLSGGEARRAALARVLAPAPDILLLDEPTNHLDLPTIEWLEGELQGRGSALVLISHDRRFLSNLSRSTAWLDRGQIRQIDRGFGAFEAWRDEVLAEEERDQHKLDRQIVNEEHWLRYGVSGRRKRNVKRLGNLFALRDQRKNYRGTTGAANLAAAEADKSGRLVIEAKNIGKSFGDRKIVDGFSIRIQRGDRIGIVGPNGAGKTTLVNLLTGADAPDAGSIRSGANIEMATLDQHRESLDPKSTLAEALTGGRSDHVMVGGKPKHVVSYMKDFLFSQEQMRTPLEVLSGGERGRLMLARALAKPSNLLVLDEPTNDLDLETLDVLEEMLGDYEGTLILISHDRDFLDRVVTSVIVPEGNGRWIEYAGGYTDMLAQRGADLKREAVKVLAVDGRKETKTSAPSAISRRRLSFHEKHALETLPTKIAKLQAEIAKQQRILDDPELFRKDRKKFDQASEALAKAQQALAEAEDKWLELEVLREEIEQA
ncbi:ABC-F family ATP-binding cassette domain-containing protein, partial [Bradyrhizobium sp.]|uniref:ABC-F family ATP-binding cassette domain-containing protein n=1 Tax=Bradyrhizobium sp. TaxID=376 RepID=UPI003C73A414